ncbi:hypothetical protein [Micromonospora craterilacus]|uniref:hypothetical protein n=1 Tax=Micromonospora craterilacus TaxID=1655439 RepID=UPI0011B604C1|nr:hypothetical protein [Micromonospora craterilacus]
MPKLKSGFANPQAPRCRLDLVCRATTNDLRLRRVQAPGGPVMPTLCCERCADHVANPPTPAPAARTGE